MQRGIDVEQVLDEEGCELGEQQGREDLVHAQEGPKQSWHQGPQRSEQGSTERRCGNGDPGRSTIEELRRQERADGPHDHAIDCTRSAR